MNDLEALKYEVDQLKQQIRVSFVLKDQCLCLLFFLSSFIFKQIWLWFLDGVISNRWGGLILFLFWFHVIMEPRV